MMSLALLANAFKTSLVFEGGVSKYQKGKIIWEPKCPQILAVSFLYAFSKYFSAFNKYSSGSHGSIELGMRVDIHQNL